jgi:hypothetical protein
MKNTITLSDEELIELEDLLRRELEESRPEYRRTRTPEFRDFLAHHIEVTEGLLRTVTRARRHQRRVGKPVGPSLT